VRGGFTPIEPLTADHGLEDLDSGEPKLDDRLVRRGLRNRE
jgi:hypothetical protein